MAAVEEHVGRSATRRVRRLHDDVAFVVAERDDRHVGVAEHRERAVLTDVVEGVEEDLVERIPQTDPRQHPAEDVDNGAQASSISPILVAPAVMARPTNVTGSPTRNDRRPPRMVADRALAL